MAGCQDAFVCWVSSLDLKELVLKCGDLGVSIPLGGASDLQTN
jgi:hypothetical protein